MLCLFLDDSLARCKAFRSHVPSACIVNTAGEAIQKLESSEWDVVFLDHDLGGEEYVNSAETNTGMEVVRWVEQNLPKVGKFIVHSLNRPAREMMTAKLLDSGYNTIDCPYIILYDGILEDIGL